MSLLLFLIIISVKQRLKCDYTNSIITCCWADGQPRTLSKLYTCNPQFDLLCVEKAKNGTQAAKLKAEINLISLKAAWKKYNVHP